MTFLNPNGIAPLDGAIAFFAVYKGSVMKERYILLHHSVLLW